MGCILYIIEDHGQGQFWNTTQWILGQAGMLTRFTTHGPRVHSHVTFFHNEGTKASACDQEKDTQGFVLQSTNFTEFHWSYMLEFAPFELGSVLIHQLAQWLAEGRHRFKKFQVHCGTTLDADIQGILNMTHMAPGTISVVNLHHERHHPV